MHTLATITNKSSHHCLRLFIMELQLQGKKGKFMSSSKGDLVQRSLRGCSVPSRNAPPRRRTERENIFVLRNIEGSEAAEGPEMRRSTNMFSLGVKSERVGG
jgi:hypothetical protein